MNAELGARRLGQGPVQGSAQVRMFDFQLVVPPDLVRPGEGVLGLAGEFQKIVGVAARAERARGFVPGTRVLGKLAQAFQHPEPHGVVLLGGHHERARPQPRQHFQRGGFLADRKGRFQAPAAPEDREPHKEAL